MIEDIYLKRLIIAEIILSGIKIKLDGFHIDEILICGNNLNSTLFVIVSDKIYVVEKEYSSIFNKVTVLDNVEEYLINSISINNFENQIVVGFIGDGVYIYDFDSDFELWNKTNLLKPTDFNKHDLFGFFVIHSDDYEILISAPNRSITIDKKEYKKAGVIYKCLRTEPFITDDESSDFTEDNFEEHNYIIEELDLYKELNIDKTFIKGNRLGYHIVKKNNNLEIKGVNNSFIY